MTKHSEHLIQETHSGVQVLAYKHRPRSLTSILQTSVEKFPDKNIFECDSEAVTFSQFSERVERLAAAMQKKLGIRKGDRVALLVGNDVAFPLVFFAAARIGAVSVPINTRFVANEIAYIFSNSGANTVFVHPDYLRECVRARKSVRNVKSVVVTGPVKEKGDYLVLDDLMADSAGGVADCVLHENELASIFYTAGTMGKPKGAMCTHRNFSSTCINVEVATGIKPDDRPLICVPFSHPTGCHGQLIAGVYIGCTSVIQRHFNADNALTLIRKANVTTLVGVPTIYWLLLAQMKLKGYDFGQLRNIIYGGAPASPELVRRLREAFPSARLGNGYGLTESSSLATFLPNEFAMKKPDSVGPPVPTVEVKIVNDDGREAPAGKIGEILLKGPNVVAGYWQETAATGETFERGWLRTGDMGRLDDGGFLYIVDRKKDVIIRGGENIYSVEIENVLESHPGVFQAAVVGEPDKVFGEQVKAYIVPNSGCEITVDEILDLCEERLADFKVPKYVEFVRALPQNPAGKVDKRALRR